MRLCRGKLARASTLSLLMCCVQGRNNTIEDGKREERQVIECERDTQCEGGQRFRWSEREREMNRAKTKVVRHAKKGETILGL